MGIKTFFASMTMKVKIIAVCAAVAVAGGVTATVVMTSAKADTYRVLKVFELTGSAVISREGSGDLDAYVGMNLESGDTLTVNDESTMRISLDNDKYVLLDSGTTIELVAEGTPADSRTSIELKEGTILNELTTSLSANSSYEIATPKATMAVRGTSFMVSVEENEDGSYIIRTNTFHGKVEVMLLDPDGKPTDKSAMVPEDKSVVIKTVPDSVSGNPAEVDGISFFVYETEEGVFVEVPEGSSPVTEIIYERIAEIVKEYVLRSNDNGSMTLKEFIVEKMRGSAMNDGTDPNTTSAETTGETSNVTSSETSAETTVPAVSESETEAQTTVPMFESETEATTTAAPITESETEATTTAVSETESETESTTTAVSETETESETEATTTTAPVTESEKDSTTTTASDRGLVPADHDPIDDDPTEKYTVSFICEGSTIYSESVEKGKTVKNIPEIPEKTGYTGKWISGGKEFSSQTVIMGDMTVTAVYTANKYTVSFISDDGVIATRSADYGSTLSDIPEIPEKTGYTGKWMSGVNEFTSMTVITEDMTVTAVYTINKYTVQFIADDVVISSEVVQHGDTVTTVPPVPEKASHIGKWMYNGEEFASDTVITEDTDVEAEYTEQYTVTFVLSADVDYVIESLNVPFGYVLDENEVDLPITIDYDGSGDYDSRDYYLYYWEFPTEPITENTVIQVNYVAYDTVREVKITDYNGEVDHYLSMVDNNITLPDTASELENYEFVGWGYLISGGYSDYKVGSSYVADDTVNHIISSDGTADYEPGADVKLTDDISFIDYGRNFKFVAVYKPIVYTVTFVLSDDEDYVIDTLTEVHYGDVPDENDVVLPTIIDYNGDSNYDSNDYYLYDWEFPTDPITEDTVIPVTYDAYDDVLEVKITDCNGEVEHFLSKVGETIPLPDTASELENYEFIGWGCITSGGYSDSSVKLGSSDITDNTGVDHMISSDGTAEFDPGADVTLTEDMRLNYYNNNGKNYKFVAIYYTLSGGTSYSTETGSGSYEEETDPSEDDSSNDDVPEEPSFNSNDAIVVGTASDPAYTPADRTETVYCDTYQNRVYSLLQNCRNIVRGLAYFISSINS
ncbi:MAG: FecR domain-containing protein [Huintestinicola sp.]